MASAPKTIRTFAGTKSRTAATGASASAHALVNPQSTADAVSQLQNTVNELIVRLNTHQHAALNAVPSVGLVTGTPQAASNLFTDN